MDFAEPCPLVRPGLPLFGFCSSGRSFASALLSDGASRRPPLRLASPLSHRTWAEDLHLPAIKHARHTRSRGRTERVHGCLEISLKNARFPRASTARVFFLQRRRTKNTYDDNGRELRVFR